MKKILFSILSILVLILIPNKVFAVEITEENLASSLEAIKNYTYTDKDGTSNLGLITSYTLDTTNKKLTIVSEGHEYVFDYTLGENPTFTYSKQYNSSITYDEYSKSDDSTIWMIPHIVALNTQGVDPLDAIAYELSVLTNALEHLDQYSSFPVITVVADGFEVETDGEHPVVTESEFGSFIINYLKENFNTEKTTFHDNASELLNSFNVTLLATDTTANSVTLKYKLTIDTTKNYASLAGLADKLNVTLEEFEKTVNNINNPTKLNQTKNGSQEIPVPDTANYFPKIIIVIGLLITCIGGLFLLKYLNTKTIKVED